MNICRQFLCITIIVTMVMGIKASKAFVVQDASKAFSYSNYVRESKPVVPTDNSSVDYSGVVNKMIAKPQGITRINMFERTSTNIVIESGKTIEIFLPEEADSLWNIDVNDKNLVRVERSEEVEGGRLLEFVALAAGKTTVFLDNIRYRGDNIDVIQSRILRFEIR